MRGNPDMNSKNFPRKLSNRGLLNIYGIFTVISLILSIYTQPFTVNENMKVIFDREIMLKSNEIKEFLIFIFSSGAIYFIVVNIIFRKKL